MPGVIGRLPALLDRLRREDSGVALIEFAYTVPLFLLLLGSGVELTNFATTHMRVSQVAVSLADNASRAKQSVVSGIPRIREADVNEVFAATVLQTTGLDIAERGRIILSSVQANAQGAQCIHCQRSSGGADSP
ncbi:MAG: pilus assembly protein, partial [Gammaproteobacteria bacterium]